ncbi:TonB-dependent receptor [bacterium]|nr:TonB-dependent receptor [bacterium]
MFRNRRLSIRAGNLLLIMSAVAILLLPEKSISATVKGVVLDEDGYSLGGVNIVVVGMKRGASSDMDGNFVISDLPEKQVVLRASMLGFKTIETNLDLSQSPEATVQIVLPFDAIALQELTFEIESEKSSVGNDGAERMEVLTSTDLETRSSDGGLLSALASGSGLDTKPCALCGAAGIGMQGLDPSYTEITVDGLPVLSGLGAMYGLDGISVSDLSQVEISKGGSRGDGGSAAMGGAVNLVTTTTNSDLKILPNGSVSLMAGETGRHRLSGEINVDGGGSPLRLSGSYASEPDKLDRNHDGLTDTPSYQRFNLSATQTRPFSGGMLSGRVRAYTENRFAGETHWTEDDRGSALVYGRDINTKRFDAGGRYVFPETRLGRFSTDAAYAVHEQDSYYGSTEYDAKQLIGIARFSFERDWSGEHSSLIRGQYRYEDYQDNLSLGSPTDRVDQIPGLLVQQEWKPSVFVNMRASLLNEYYEEDGYVLIPRASLLYSPTDRWTFIASSGTGYRTVTLFSLDKAAHAGFDNVIIPGQLKAEKSLGGSFTTQYQAANLERAFSFDITGFYTRFENKVILGFADSHSGAVYYKNATDAFTRGGEFQASYAFNPGWNFRTNVAFTDVQYEESSEWRREELRSLYTAGFQVQREWQLSGWRSDVQFNLFGPQELPEDRDRDQSPTFVTVDAGVAKSLGRYTVRLQLENLTDYVQPDPVLVADEVSGKRVDAAMIYGPQLGRTVLVTISADFGSNN